MAPTRKRTQAEVLSEEVEKLKALINPLHEEERRRRQREAWRDQKRRQKEREEKRKIEKGNAALKFFEPYLKASTQASASAEPSSSSRKGSSEPSSSARKSSSIHPVEMSADENPEPGHDSQDLLAEINRLKEVLKAHLSKNTLHDSQDEPHDDEEDVGWSSARSKIFEECLLGATNVDLALCVNCHGKSDVRCGSCGSLCGNCDKRIHHKSLLLHDRTDGNGHYLPDNVFLCRNNSLVERENLGKWFPAVAGGERCTCGGCAFLSVDGNTPLSVITVQGRFNITVGMLQCTVCGARQKPKPLSYIRLGFWPSSVRRLRMLISEEVLRHCSILVKLSPRTSVTAYCRLLTNISAHRPGNSTVRPDMFSDVLREFTYCQEGLSQYLEPNCLVCPSCTTNQHAAHIDGNFKLYRLKGNASDPRASYYGDSFIAADEDVLKLVDAVRGSDKRMDKTCGDRVWKAGLNILGRSRANIDETGLSIVTCRHMVVQKALNTLRGEIFEYALYHEIGVCSANRAKFICMDVACQYWPWSQQHNKLLPQGYYPKPFLSVMHAKAHVFNCQVIWGGRWQDGSGLTTGESTELVNSYLSKFGTRTKYMTKAGREESLTEGALFWNREKIRGLAKYLRNQYKKALYIHKNSGKNIKSTRELHELAEWRAVLEQLASRDKQNKLPVEQQMELLFASIERKRMDVTTLADSCKERNKINASVRRELAKLTSLIQTYNTGKTAAVTLADFASGSLPWTEKLLPGSSASLPKMRQAVEEHLLLQRSAEELCILREEMKNYLAYYEQQLKECDTHSEVRGRTVPQYRLSAPDTSPALGQALERLHALKKEFLEQQLEEGVLQFSEALADGSGPTPTEDWPVSESEVDSDEGEDDFDPGVLDGSV